MTTTLTPAEVESQARRETSAQPLDDPPPTSHPRAVAKPSMLEGVRALATMYGPSLVLDLFVAGSLIAAGRGALTRPPKTRAARLLRVPIALGVAAPAAYLLAIRPWLRSWGATTEEAHRPLPGDEL